MGRISKETATAIALSYREVEAARKLLARITSVISEWQTADIHEVFEVQEYGLKLGVPQGKGRHNRLFNVPWAVAKPIIEAHIAHHEAVIRALSEKARIEASEVSSAIRADEAGHG